MCPLEATDAPAPPSGCQRVVSGLPVALAVRAGSHKDMGRSSRPAFTGHAAAIVVRRRGGPTSIDPGTAPGEANSVRAPLAPSPPVRWGVRERGGGCCGPRATPASAVRGNAVLWVSGKSGNCPVLSGFSGISTKNLSFFLGWLVGCVVTYTELVYTKRQFPGSVQYHG